MKIALKNSAMVSYPREGAELELTTDASNVACGAVLHQIHNGVKESLAFFSRKFSPREAVKSAFDRELFAIYLSLRNFELLMEQQFTIFTVQKALVHGLTMQKPTPQQARWFSYVSECGCTIKHVSGAENVVADALSRSINAVQGFRHRLAGKTRIIPHCQISDN